MNVVDIGCYWHPEHQGQSLDSMGRLIERFQPERVIGYDPQVRLQLNDEYFDLYPVAVWTKNGEVPWFSSRGALVAGVGVDDGATVLCVDIAEVVKEAGEGCVVKIDAEGGEYELLKRLHETGTDKLISLLLVEWHGDPEPGLVDCPVEVWE